MNISFAIESDLKRRMSAWAHALSVLVLCCLGLATLPSASVAQPHDRMAGSDVESIMERVDAALVAVSERVETAVAQGRLTPEEGEEKLRQARGDVIWKAALSMDPDQWPEPLQALILELRPGATIEQFAQWARDKRQKNAENEREKSIWAAAMAQDPSEWSDRLKAAILELKPKSTLEEIAEGIRQRQRYMQLSERLRTAVEAGQITEEEATKKLEEARSKMGRDAGTRGQNRLAEFRRGVLERAMAEDPDQWNQRLLEAIARAGWDAEALADRIRAHRARNSEGEATLRDMAQLVEELQLDTSVQTRSWGKIKNEQRD
ncbi:MAG: hypothetical protein VXW00_03905 [Candidatus Latescibacterota bacterium]|nr:hypothetical protein [Candidatus Latescibacterota bacterium]